MKHVLLFFSFLFIINLYATEIQLDAVQQKVVQRAPYLNNLIQAYNARLSVDQQAELAIDELVVLMHRFYPDVDPHAYKSELLKKYNASIDADRIGRRSLHKMDVIENSAQINDGDGNCWSVSSAQSTKSELIFTVWQDERSGIDDPDIYGQFFDLNMEAVGGNFIVHTANGDVAQNHPAVAALSNGGFVVVWEDYRHNDGAIFARLFADDRTPVANEFQIEPTTGGQLKPAVAANGNGQFTVTWLQNGGTDYNIYARVYENDATALTPTFMVNDDKNAFQWFPSIAGAHSGESLIVWEDKRNGKSDIYAQRLRADGSKRAGNFQVDDAVGNPTQWQPDVTAGANQFVVAWEDFRDNPGGIYAQWFNSSLLTDGDNVRVDDYAVSTIKELPAAAINDAGETTFCWQDGRDEYYHLCAQTYTADKNADLYIKIMTDENSEQRFPDLLMNDRVLSFFWVQMNTTNDATSIYAEQVLWTEVPVELSAFNLSVQNENVKCSWTTLSETNNLGFAVERSLDGIDFKEIEFVDGSGTTTESHHYDCVDSNPPRGAVYYRLKQVDFDGSVSHSSVQHVFVELPRLYALLGNYPNPFNPTTTITYQLDSSEFVTLEILDIHGRVIDTLVDEKQQRGLYKISWNGWDYNGNFLASGLYFCILKTSTESVAVKMILAK